MLNVMPNVLVEILYQNITDLLAVVVATTALVLYFFEHYKYQQLKKSRQLTPPKVEEQSYGILHHALKKARSILGNAELESVKIMADSSFYHRKIEERIDKSLTEELTNAQNEYIKYLNELKNRGQQAQSASEEFIKQKTNQLFERFEQNLTNFLTQTERQSVSSIELELKATRQLIDTYKSQQLTMIDENIVAVLERTLSLVLPQKLTLKDQSDLVLEAFDRAKVEKFFI